MAKYKQLDIQDRAAFAALDKGFNDDGEVASISGEMTVEFVRVARVEGDLYWMTVRFPGGEAFDVRLLRGKLLEQLDIGDGES